ncbi:phosphopantetheine-binding protein [soil metagenome]
MLRRTQGARSLHDQLPGGCEITMDPLVQELKTKIIESLNLQDVKPEDIGDADPLFRSGLGLDSIDALELSVMLERSYGIRITDMKVGRQAFSSVNALAGFVRENRSPCQDSA